jgi:hypothetical protein
MPTFEEIEHKILHEIQDSHREQDAIIRSYFCWRDDPDSVDDEMLVKILRWRRNGLLIDSDWTQIPDSPVDKQAWLEYRQQLRDLLSQNPDPRLIVFPNRPDQPVVDL